MALTGQLATFNSQFGQIALGQSPRFVSFSMPLFLKTVEPYTTSGDLNLIVQGSTYSGITADLDLFMRHVSGEANVASGVMPLYLAGATSAFASGDMPMFVAGEYRAASAALNLFVYNTGVSGMLPLFIQGEGLADTALNALPASGVLNLYLARTTSFDLPLLLFCAEPASGLMDLYTTAHDYIVEDLELSMANVHDVGSGIMTLYVNGRVP